MAESSAVETPYAHRAEPMDVETEVTTALFSSGPVNLVEKPVRTPELLPRISRP
ncbi:hypothetical protein IscW_ISCW007087 [Ixodes scapularis]|uniref:Uncharacterized protein n=1 Tax=Ixodes scapularis TaxID=6945 RepID=B7PWS9_IXOSC|nr:hypothetical protein IscW_ISCW007087 [Ixodes scapularis]|eukprot:XP_002410235.1 hypothetical protein IscW_ISCW007087 [Ixodes scapularis]